jgi:hypothetical protein
VRPRRSSGALGQPLNFAVRQHETRRLDMNSGAPRLLLLVSLAIFAPSPSPADARLLGLDSPNRVPGSFFVVFKTGPELVAVARTGPAAPKVLPQVFPTSKDSDLRLAEALCEQIHGQLEGLSYSPSSAAFVVRRASDTLVHDILAKDPRIAEIGANFPIHD